MGFHPRQTLRKYLLDLAVLSLVLENQLYRLRNSARAGISLVEVIITLTLVGVLVAMTINLVLVNPRGKWNKMTDDYILHLASVYHQYQLKNGLNPVKPSNTDGIPGMLPDWETASTYDSSNNIINYPNNMQVQLQAEDFCGGLLSDACGSDLGTALGCTWPDSTNNREWIVIDINGNEGPNSLGCDGEQVVIYINNETGQVMTANQWNSSCQVSYYDVYSDGDSCSGGSTSSSTTSTSGSTSGGGEGES
jgi:type II secretory pathway pseudopilin PulG